MRTLVKYVGFSTLAAGAVIYHAFATKEQFFPSMYYLSNSKVALAAVSNFAFAMMLCTYHLITKTFLGTLRDAEVERINERMGQAVMETCLAMTMFREEFNIDFAAMFAVLTLVKICHWLAQDRVDYMETTPSVSRWMHFRMLSFMALLLTLDSAFLQYSVTRMLKRHTGVHLLFAFEYMILSSIVISIFLKHMLAAIDNFLEGRWEQKGVYVFYLELITDMIHLLIYMVFFVIVFTQHGLPLHLVRDLYWTFRNFRNRVADFLRYRRVTANMDERFADATPEDLQRCDGVCIICREDMSAEAQSRAKRLACSHVFHLHCLRSWLERQQNCPICRTSVFAPRPEDAHAHAGDAPAAEPEAPNPELAGAGLLGADPAGVVHAPVELGAGQVGLRHRWHVLPQHPPAAAMAEQPAAHAPHAPAMEGGEGLRGRAEGAAPAAGLMPGPPPVGLAPGMWPPANLGIMWNMPQWAPATSMALYLPAAHVPMQYAGQQGPDVAAVPGSQSMAVPLLPLVIPQALLNPMAPMGPAAAPQQQQQQQGGPGTGTPPASASSASATAAHWSAFGNMMMVPPSILTHGVSTSVPPMSSDAMTYTAMNAAAAAAYVAASRAPPRTEALELLLRQQRDAIDQHLAVMERDRAQAVPQGPEPAASSSDSNVPEASVAESLASDVRGSKSAAADPSRDCSRVSGGSPGTSPEEPEPEGGPEVAQPPTGEDPSVPVSL